MIGIMGDIDGLPETSQTPGVAYHKPLIPGGPGHGEGHNSAPAVDVVGAIALKRVMEKYGIPGEIRVIPGVAEELVASRTYMVMSGMFEDMDAMLSTHVSSNFSTSYGISGSGAGLDAVQLSRQVGARGGLAVGGAERAGRGRADGHRLELPP